MNKSNIWYSVSLGDGIMSAMPSADIETHFQQLYPAGDIPPAMAVFTRAESEGRLHCEVIAYFSPAAGKIANIFAAEPCVKPVRTGLGLLVGVEEAWTVLFPER